LTNYSIVIKDINNLKFIFPEGELSSNTCYLQEKDVLLEKSIQGVDFSNKKQVADFLKGINYFTDERKYNKVLQFQGDELALCKYISISRLKYYSIPETPVVYMSEIYSKNYLDRVNYIRQCKDYDKFLTDTFRFVKKVLKFDQYTPYKDVLLKIRARLDRNFIKAFQVFGDEWDIYLFQGALKD
jgi:hypothetical protein